MNAGRPAAPGVRGVMMGRPPLKRRLESSGKRAYIQPRHFMDATVWFNALTQQAIRMVMPFWLETA